MTNAVLGSVPSSEWSVEPVTKLGTLTTPEGLIIPWVFQRMEFHVGQLWYTGWDAVGPAKGWEDWAVMEAPNAS